jgi:hypothetical protein
MERHSSGYKNWTTWNTINWEEDAAWRDAAYELVRLLAPQAGHSPLFIKNEVREVITDHFSQLLDEVAPEASLVRDLLQSAIDEIDVDSLAWKAVEEALWDEEANGDLGIDPYFVEQLRHEAEIGQRQG